MNVTRVITTAAVALLAIATASQAQPLKVTASGSKTVKLSDRVGKNQFEWLSTAPLEEIKGTAEGVSGTITLDPRNPASLRGTISAQVATMKSGNDTRDGHLRGPAWLDATTFPTISFTIASVSGLKVSGNEVSGTATGKFTMHGVTKQITIPFTLKYIDANAKTRERAPGDLVMVTAKFDVSLRDYNVAGSKGTIGSKVGETITVNAKLFGSTGL